MNPNQILAIIYLLLAFGVPQPTVDTVQSILQKANTVPVQQTTAPMQQTNLAGSAPEQPSCVDAPVLTLTESSSTSNSVTLEGTYSTGCNLDPNTKSVFKTDRWIEGNAVDYNYGTLGHFGSYLSGWSLQGPDGQYGVDGNPIYTSADFGATIMPYRGQKIATLTVGNITATTTITAQ